MPKYTKKPQPTLESRFWKNVDMSDLFSCWNWTGTITQDGYGQINHNSSSIIAHRLSWKINFGEIPKGMQINHKCSNRKCVNPNHLYCGTQQDNIRDMLEQERQARGVRINCAKLTEQQVLEIRKAYSKEQNGVKLGKTYRVSKRAITAIVNRETWKHI